MPSIAVDPLPYIVALWARASEIGVTTIFSVMTLAAAIILEELSMMADRIREKINGSSGHSLEVEKWRSLFVLLCNFIDQINHFFGPILVIKTAIAFAMSIFDFNLILQSKGQYPRFYFQYVHTILRFLVFLVPSYLVTQTVKCKLKNMVLGL